MNITLASIYEEKDIIGLIEKTYFFIGKDLGFIVKGICVLDKIPINRLKWTVRFKNALTSIKEITSLKDLLNTDYEKFLRLDNCGRKTIHDARQAIISFLKKNLKNIVEETNIDSIHLQVTDAVKKEFKGEEIINKSETKENINLIEGIENLFSDTKKRDLGIALIRWDSDKLITYEEIGIKYNVTRERIRQILGIIIRNLTTKYKISINEWKQSILNSLIQKPIPISIEIFKEYKLKYSPQLYLGIFSEIFDEVPFEGFLPKSFEQLIKRNTMHDSKWKVLIETLENLKLFPGEMTTQYLVNILSLKGFSISDQLLCFKIILGSNRFFFFKEDSKYFLLRSGGIRESTYSILSSSDNPLDINVLMQKFRKYYGKDSKYDSLNSVVGNLKQDERIIQFDRYTFGAKKHFVYPKESWSTISTMAKNFLSEMNRQCYVTEILERIKTEFPLLRSKYELVNILRTDQEIFDLGFFTFSVMETGIKSRIKLKDLILKIFKDNPRIKHYIEIRDEILSIRHVRSEGLNVLLKNVNEIIKYPCSFYGMKDLKKDNIYNLSKHHQFIKSYVSSVIYPDTKISKLFEFFETDTNKNNCLLVIQDSNELKVIDSLTSTEPFVVSTNWSLIKLVKTILFNYHKPMYLAEIKWILNDLGIKNEMFDENKYKIIEDKQIIRNNQTLEYFDFDKNINQNNDLIDTFYELLLDTKTTFAFRDFVSEFNDDLEQEGLDEKKLRAILEDDERFIITDEMIMVKAT